MIKTTLYEDVLQLTLCKYDAMIPGSFVSAYLVDGVLIDTGLAHTAEALLALLKGKELKSVVNTHHHEDHIGANKLLQDHFGVDIFAHPLAVDKISEPADLYPYQVEVWGHPVPSVAKQLGRRFQTDRNNFEIIHTPGHDRDHVCLLDADSGILFSGDLFLGTNPTRSRPMEDNWQIIEDLKQVCALHPKVIYSSSGMVFSDPRKRLETVIATLEEIGDKVKHLYQKGMTAQQIMERIFVKESPMAEMTQFQFSSVNMVKCFLKSLPK
jgi:hydroxyacylglutathione hydrolase